MSDQVRKQKKKIKKLKKMIKRLKRHKDKGAVLGTITAMVIAWAMLSRMIVTNDEE